MSKWISEYEQAIQNAGIPTYTESAKIRGYSFASFDGDGYHPFHDLLSNVDKIKKGELTQQELNDKIERMDRFAFVRKYGFAIPSLRALNLIAHLACGKGLVEVGAGMGYWLYESLKIAPQRGWAATDSKPPIPEAEGNPYRFEKPWMPVEKISGVEAVSKYSGRDLMMIWPSYDEQWPFDTLKAFKGSAFAYVGEGSGGCNGDERFWNLIEAEWNEVEEERIPFWWGIHDRLTVFERKRTS